MVLSGPKKWVEIISVEAFYFVFIFTFNIAKFVYSEKATKFCEISPLLLSTVHLDKIKVEISQNFVAFSEYVYDLYLVMKYQEKVVLSTFENIFHHYI